jgi:dihydropteroate synthase
MDINLEQYNGFPKIMGILNLTPDSFSDGGSWVETEKAVSHALEMIEQGADIIDIGGESTRPGADVVDVETELRRVIPVIEAIRKENQDIPISIDTTKSEVARAAIEAGADIINDVSGLDYDESIADVAAEYDKMLILMHMKGNPKNMQQNACYSDLTNEIFLQLSEKIQKAKEHGVKKIVADVGIGFGKKLPHNRLLLKNHRIFESLGVPLLLGISRKSFIKEAFGIEEPIERDFETAVIHAMMLKKQIDIIRVHNVEILARVKKIHEFLV